ncbi:abc-type amino acid transport system, periplasmic component [Secundilactobacillus odoratitofui DSM 19909 = JCM 15043]|uniref:Abc-type amino acid transport system, periplasmic component n=1 Tax=Secundilactobacillus odoratitofui DSM 19909 = JCM 15043 TaxID=1423776 RepID=A0A0R1LNM8_9LACO|nr:transporter substrate-binding domain-containing protein [Secundilactobacillus odoratitofui]KRK97461.1 abc-type amino acid transport system, periplasmic component [Secundilactobacillus odoratitofui DSM 19909 = JCM 15043]
MKKHRYGLWAVIIIVILVIGGAFWFTSSKKSAKSTTKPTIKIATAGTIFPNAFQQNHKLTGYDVDVAKAVAKAEGYKTKFTVTDFDGIFGQVDSGRVDTVANDIGATPERKQKYIFSTPYNNETTNIAAKKGTSYKNLKDFEGKTVATSGAGNNFITSLQKYDSKIKIKVYETRDQATQALITGRVDGLLYSRSTLSAIIKKQNLNWHVVNGNAGQALVAYPFKNDANGKKLRKVFNKGLAKIKKNGTLNKISNKYFGYDITNEIK